MVLVIVVWTQKQSLSAKDCKVLNLVLLHINLALLYILRWEHIANSHGPSQWNSAQTTERKGNVTTLALIVKQILLSAVSLSSWEHLARESTCTCMSFTCKVEIGTMTCTRMVPSRPRQRDTGGHHACCWSQGQQRRYLSNYDISANTISGYAGDLLF